MLVNEAVFQVAGVVPVMVPIQRDGLLGMAGRGRIEQRRPDQVRQVVVTDVPHAAGAGDFPCDLVLALLASVLQYLAARAGL